MSEPLRVGLVGYGLAGRHFHAPLIEAEPDLELARVVRSRDVDTPWEDGLDVAVIATPNRFHVPLAVRALERGLHVVVDKPLAPAAAGARQIARAAEHHGRVAAVFHNRRWDGDALTLEALLARDALGDVHRFESRFERWRPEIKEGAWRERADPEEAGGVLFDLGSHLIDQALWLFGPARVVHAEVERRRPGAAVDDDAFVALEHEAGVRSHLWMSQAAAQPGPRLRVLGSRAAYVKRGLDPQEAQLRAGAKPGDDGFGREPRERWGLLGDESTAEPVETAAGDYLAFYSGLVRAIRGEAPPPVPLADAIAVLEAIEAARAIAS